MVDADQAAAVFEVGHVTVDAMPGVLGSQGGMRSGLDADDSPSFGASPNDLVGLHAGGGPECPRSGVGDRDGGFAGLDGLQGGSVSRMGAVDEDAQLIHPTNRPVAEGGQAAVVGFGETAAERVGFAVGDPEGTDPAPVEDVQAVKL